MKRILLLAALAGLLAAMLVAPALAQAPEVEVSDQDVTDGMVTIARVVYEKEGWIVIHKDADGKPGPVIGWAAIKPGENTNVVVKLQEDLMGPTKLWAMLHTDAGTVGEYEFPGADTPVKVGDAVVVKPFTAAPAPTIMPTTGGTPLPVLPLALVTAGALLILGAFAFRYRPQAR